MSITSNLGKPLTIMKPIHEQGFKEVINPVADSDINVVIVLILV